MRYVDVYEKDKRAHVCFLQVFPLQSATRVSIYWHGQDEAHMSGVSWGC